MKLHRLEKARLAITRGWRTIVLMPDEFTHAKTQICRQSCKMVVA